MADESDNTETLPMQESLKCHSRHRRAIAAWAFIIMAALGVILSLAGAFFPDVAPRLVVMQPFLLLFFPTLCVVVVSNFAAGAIETGAILKLVRGG